MSSTPGPWDNIPQLNHEDKTWTYVIIAGDDDTEVAEVALPDDSNLIAAAPDLLAACEKLRETWDLTHVRADFVDQMVIGERFAAIDAAIAKARGES